MSHIEDAAYLTWLKQECGYRDITPLGDGRWKAIYPLLYTNAVIVGLMGARWGYQDRWCYHSYELALVALLAWDGTGEPQGWHRHPGSGRRRDELGQEYVAP
jgi:hypothetical protein